MADDDPAVPSARAWQLVLEHIEARLLSGDLAPGDRLPGERQLSAGLGVGRSSVREALRVLEAMGLIRTATGSGPNAGAIVVSTPGGAMGALMRLQVAARGFPVADIVHARVLIESAVAAELAEAEPRPSLADAERLLASMDEPGLGASDFIALDAAFHLALSEASGNQVIAATMAGLRVGIEGYVRDGVARIDDWDGEVERLRREHHGIVDAIRSGDASGARSLVAEHIAGYFAETLREHP